jgi:hypothetical protein
MQEAIGRSVKVTGRIILGRAKVADVPRIGRSDAALFR